MELSIEGSDPADSWYDISTADQFSEDEGDFMINWKERGYSTILDILMVNSSFSVLCNTEIFLKFTAYRNVIQILKKNFQF